MKKTEQRNPNSMHIDKMSALEIAKCMNNEDKTVAFAVEKALPEIAQTIEAVVDSFNKGGRLLLIGAGTSGRLGIIDATECPPTYGEPPEKVVGIMAGGRDAVFKASENGEDMGSMGVEDIKSENICEKDTLIGISVAGNAMYVKEALVYAKSVGAKTVALTCNEDAHIAKVADIAIITDTGAEVVTGSTRLKAGTAHKLVLNTITTGSMIMTGHVIENHMVNMKPTNIKLKERAARIISDIAGIELEKAREEVATGSSIRDILAKYGK
ncbi:MAG: N-acetylmuramic acid 6-phosphate etherase [Clostridia bacterium]|nr:N-acetylmuramic acid 6-phosphate etherase [Clostridia bacterium]